LTNRSLADVVLGGETTSGALLARRAAQVAQGLVDMGVGEGDVIALMLRNDLPYLELMQACRIVGCYFCQVNWHLTASEVAYILDDSGAKALFVHQDLLPPIAQAIPAQVRVFAVRPNACVSLAYPAAGGHATTVSGAIDYASWVDSRQPFSGPPRVPVGDMGYTSGTTGRLPMRSGCTRWWNRRTAFAPAREPTCARRCTTARPACSRARHFAWANCLC
jgi:long-chain acyl-CoA synthetase